MQHAFGAGDEGRNTHGIFIRKCIFIRKEGRSMARASLRIKIVFLSDEKPSVQFFGKLSDGRIEVIPCRMAKSPLYKRPSGGGRVTCKSINVRKYYCCVLRIFEAS